MSEVLPPHFLLLLLLLLLLLFLFLLYYQKRSNLYLLKPIKMKVSTERTVYSKPNPYFTGGFNLPLRLFLKQKEAIVTQSNSSQLNQFQTVFGNENIIIFIGRFVLNRFEILHGLHISGNVNNIFCSPLSHLNLRQYIDTPIFEDGVQPRDV